jgi:hypothetical protein
LVLVLKLTAVLKAESAVDRAHLLRIPGQSALQALQPIDRERAQGVERQQRERVLRPAHRGRGVHPAQTIEAALERRTPARHGAGAVEYPGHVQAQRLDQQQQHDQVDRQLQPTRGVHG